MAGNNPNSWWNTIGKSGGYTNNTAGYQKYLKDLQSGKVNTSTKANTIAKTDTKTGLGTIDYGAVNTNPQISESLLNQRKQVYFGKSPSIPTDTYTNQITGKPTNYVPGDIISTAPVTYNDSTGLVELDSANASEYGLSAGSYTPDQLNTAGNNYTTFTQLSPDTQAALGAAGATFGTDNKLSGVDYSKINNFFNTDGTVDMDKFSVWAELNPEAAAGIGGSLTFDNNNIGKFNGLTGKDNTFLGLGNEGWGNVLKGGGLVLQGIGLSDQLKTNKKQREAMDFDLQNARAEKAALDKYRAAYA